MINYIKYSATGNTFIAIDNRENQFSGSDELVIKICTKHDVDGLICVETSEKADFKFRYYNRDGGEVEMCGNGLRAITQFAHSQLKLPQKNGYQIETMNSVYQTIPDEQLPSVLMSEFYDENKIEVHDLFDSLSSYYVNTGVPHSVFEVENVENTNLLEVGKKVRWDKRFSHGCNTNIYSAIGNYIKVRTFERGVEGETGSCGTGITAVAQYLFRHKNKDADLKIIARDGELLAKKDKNGVWLSGPVTILKEGSEAF